jgi:hypothetical protein
VLGNYHSQSSNRPSQSLGFDSLPDLDKPDFTVFEI